MVDNVAKYEESIARPGALLRQLFAAQPSSPRKKPLELIYGVDDVPPLSVVFVGALQNVGLLSILLIYPVLLIKQAGLAAGPAANVLSLTLLTLGIGTLLQVLPRGPIGSGYMCPPTVSAVYLTPSLAAIKLGGLPLVFGMTVFAGVIETVVSPVLRRIRPLLPPEIGGLVIFFVGVTLAALGFRYILGTGTAQPLGAAHWVVVGITLGVTVGLNVWARGQARMFCALIGMVIGYLVAIFTGLLGAQDFHVLGALPVVAFPSFSHLSWSFSPAMVLPFLIAALASTVKAVGLIAVSQRVTDAGWVRPDMGSVSRGVLADGLGSIIAGLFGSMGVNVASTNVGLIAATGVASRVIGYAVSFLLIALAFFPVATGLLIVMPAAVMGAALVFSACFILINGMQTITSRLLDARRSIVIGLAMAIGVAAEIIPNFAANVPEALKSVAGSSLVLGTLTALLLNALFRIGQRKRVTLKLDPLADARAEQIEEFFNGNGRRWGARRDVMDRVAFGINQAIEVIRDCCGPQGPFKIDAQFDEFNLNVQISYNGTPIELPDHRPSDAEILETETGHIRLAGFLLRRNADRIRTSAKDGAAVLEFYFEH